MSVDNRYRSVFKMSQRSKNRYFINYEKVIKMNLSAMKSFNAFASGDAPLTKQSELIRLEWLESKLPTDDIDESQLIYTHGDALINQFFSGNWSQSVQTMKDHYVGWNDLLEYMQSSEMCMEECLCDVSGYGRHFDNAFWAELGYALGRDS